MWKAGDTAALPAFLKHIQNQYNKDQFTTDDQRLRALQAMVVDDKQDKQITAILSGHYSSEEYLQSIRTNFSNPRGLATKAMEQIQELQLPKNDSEQLRNASILQSIKRRLPEKERKDLFDATRIQELLNTIFNKKHRDMFDLALHDKSMVRTDAWSEETGLSTDVVPPEILHTSTPDYLAAFWKFVTRLEIRLSTSTTMRSQPTPVSTKQKPTHDKPPP